MEVISHRGYWLNPKEKNTELAFERSFRLGFGTETDIRDCLGELVISHDMPKGNEMTVARLFEIYNENSCTSPLALNIKSDGLQEPLKQLLKEHRIENYFLFDMSVPDAIVSIKHGLTCFTRQSEYEKECSFYDQSSGVWLDEFINDWIGLDAIEQHKKNGKKICIVSPDLHGRDPLDKWQELKAISNKYNLDDVILCTDHPEKAMDILNEKN